MSDAKHAFDPNWPHGHWFMLSNGTTYNATILTTSLRGVYHILAQYGGAYETFTREGLAVDQDQNGPRLINRPAPEPVVVDTLCFMNTFASPQARDVAGRPIRANIEVTCEFMSDGSVRASAEVVK